MGTFDYFYTDLQWESEAGCTDKIYVNFFILVISLVKLDRHEETMVAKKLSNIKYMASISHKDALQVSQDLVKRHSWQTQGCNKVNFFENLWEKISRKSCLLWVTRGRVSLTWVIQKIRGHSIMVQKVLSTAGARSEPWCHPCIYRI